MSEQRNIMWNVGNILYAAQSLLRGMDGELAEAFQKEASDLWDRVSAEAIRMHEDEIREYKKLLEV